MALRIESGEVADRTGPLFGDNAAAEPPPHPALRATFSPVKNGGEGTYPSDEELGDVRHSRHTFSSR